jgi:hypothetical protein
MKDQVKKNRKVVGIKPNRMGGWCCCVIAAASDPVARAKMIFAKPMIAGREQRI